MSDSPSTVPGQGQLFWFPPSILHISARWVWPTGYRVSLAVRHEGEAAFSEDSKESYDGLSSSELVDVIDALLEKALTAPADRRTVSDASGGAA